MKCIECENEMISYEKVETGFVCPECGYFTESLSENLKPPISTTWDSDDVGVFFKKGQKCYKRSLSTLHLFRLHQTYDGYIEAILRKFSQSDSVKKEVSEMFYNLCRNHLLNKNHELKVKYMIACVRITLEQNDVHIPLVLLCNEVPIDSRGIHKITNEVASIFDKTERPKSYFDSLDIMIKNIPSMSKNEELALKAKKIVKILDAISFVTGSNRYTIAQVASYLSFVSQEKTGSKRMAFNKFIKMNKLKCAKMHPLHKIADRLILMILKLPWMTDNKKVNFSNFHFYIDDVIKHCDYLVPLVSKNEEEVDKAENSEASCSSEKMTDEDFETPISYLKFISRNKRKVEVVRKDAKVMKVASSQEFLTEDDIPDTELCHYIRCSEEIENAKKIYKLLSEKDSSS